ncbi:hypothetical protein L218DRAFT_683193 [Marasmius fiardii PR-910]|nr:hypothetical protein L218DRAFT_683193 [Marasmius fiardii PR-910]
MATTAYTIYSHYETSERERLKFETGQIQIQEAEGLESATVDVDDWEAEALKARRGLPPIPPPRFVRATNLIDHRQDGSTSATSAGRISTTNENDVSSWYRSLTEKSSQKVAQLQRKKDLKPSILSSASHPFSPQLRLIDKEEAKPQKGAWFIQKALLQSQPESETHGHGTADGSLPTLADILARDPPPRPSTGDKFQPPVFLALGPSNKGYTLLEDSGWTEGEALGVDAVRSKGRKRKHRDQGVIIRDIGDGEVKEVYKIIDLTGSDSEVEEQDELVPRHEPIKLNLPPASSTSTSASTRKALITPLPTILKSDRLGVGLKAKTAGPYKASVKRITHNSAALVAHLKRAEDARKRREKHGRGHRAYARLYKEEQRRRAEMQAYMNS